MKKFFLKLLAISLGFIGVIIAATFVLGFTVLLLGGGWTFIEHYFGLIKTMETPVAAAIVTASGAIFVSVISVLIAKHIENKRFIEKDIRDKKVPVYEELFAYFFQFMAHKQTKSMEDFMNEFSAKFVIYGSDEVITAWDNFKKAATSADKPTIMKAFERLILVIRKDIGHENKNINQGALLRMIIKDID